MVSFQTFFLEYAHHMADGTPKITIYSSNKKGSRDIAKPNDMKRKYVTTKGPYKPLNPKVHKLGYVFVGNELTDVLITYNLEFKDGKISKIKSSLYALHMFTTPQGNKAQVVQVK